LCEDYGIVVDASYFLFEHLAPALWITDRQDSDWVSDFWWHFRDAGELEGVCEEALALLLKYGIPYVEDLRSSSFILEEMKRACRDSS
jgi:hypothetical protein